MGSRARQKKQVAERKRREDCPHCDVPMREQWHTETDWRGTTYHARCAQCGTTFVLTSEGWEEAALDG